MSAPGPMEVEKYMVGQREVRGQLAVLSLQRPGVGMRPVVLSKACWAVRQLGLHPHPD